MGSTRDTTTVRGPQNPLVGGYQRAQEQGGGIIPGAQSKTVAASDQPIAGPKEILSQLQRAGSSILDTITGRKRNSTNNNMSPTTTKDKGY